MRMPQFLSTATKTRTNTKIFIAIGLLAVSGMFATGSFKLSQTAKIQKQAPTSLIPLEQEKKDFFSTITRTQKKVQELEAVANQKQFKSIDSQNLEQQKDAVNKLNKCFSEANDKNSIKKCTPASEKLSELGKIITRLDHKIRVPLILDQLTIYNNKLQKNNQKESPTNSSNTISALNTRVQKYYKNGELDLAFAEMKNQRQNLRRLAQQFIETRQGKPYSRIVDIPLEDLLAVIRITYPGPYYADPSRVTTEFSTHKMLMLYMIWSRQPQDTRTLPYTLSQMTDMTQEIADWYKEQSYGKFLYTTDIVSIIAGVNEPEYYETVSTGIALAGSSIDFSQYDVIIVYPGGNSSEGIIAPADNERGYVGLIRLGHFSGKNALTHEIGHTINIHTALYTHPDPFTPPEIIGMAHSSDLLFPDNSLIDFTSNDCNYNEYGSFDMMGEPANYHFNIINKQRLGWLSKDTQQVINGRGSYILSANESSNLTIPKQLVIPINDVTGLRYISLEFRKPSLVGVSSSGLVDIPNEGALLARLRVTDPRSEIAKQWIYNCGEYPDYYDVSFLLNLNPSNGMKFLLPGEISEVLGNAISYEYTGVDTITVRVSEPLPYSLP